MAAGPCFLFGLFVGGYLNYDNKWPWQSPPKVELITREILIHDSIPVPYFYDPPLRRTKTETITAVSTEVVTVTVSGNGSFGGGYGGGRGSPGRWNEIGPGSGIDGEWTFWDWVPNWETAANGLFCVFLVWVVVFLYRLWLEWCFPIPQVPAGLGPGLGPGGPPGGGGGGGAPGGGGGGAGGGGTQGYDGLGGENEEEVKNLRDQNATLTQEVSTQASRIAELERENRRQAKRIEDLEAQHLRDTASQWSGNNPQLRKRDARIAELEAGLQQRDDEIARLKSELDQVKNSTDDAGTSGPIDENGEPVTQESYDNLVNERIAFEVQLDASDESGDKTKLANQSADLKTENDTLKREKKAVEDELAAQNAKLKEHEDSSKAARKKASSDEEKAAAEQSKLEAKIKKLEEKNADVQRDLTLCQQHRKQQGTENDELAQLKKENENLKEANEKLEGKLKQLEKDNVEILKAGGREQTMLRIDEYYKALARYEDKAKKDADEKKDLRIEHRKTADNMRALLYKHQSAAKKDQAELQKKLDECEAHKKQQSEAKDGEAQVGSDGKKPQQDTTPEEIIRQLRAKIAELEQKLKDCEAGSQKRDEKNDSKKDAKGSTKSREEQFQDLKSDLLVARVQLSTLETRNDELQEENDLLKVRLASLSGDEETPALSATADDGSSSSAEVGRSTAAQGGKTACAKNCHKLQQQYDDLQKLYNRLHRKYEKELALHPQDEDDSIDCANCRKLKSKLDKQIAVAQKRKEERDAARSRATDLAMEKAALADNTNAATASAKEFERLETERDELKAENDSLHERNRWLEIQLEYRPEDASSDQIGDAIVDGDNNDDDDFWALYWDQRVKLRGKHNAPPKTDPRFSDTVPHREYRLLLGAAERLWTDRLAMLKELEKFKQDLEDLRKKYDEQELKLADCERDRKGARPGRQLSEPTYWANKDGPTTGSASASAPALATAPSTGTRANGATPAPTASASVPAPATVSSKGTSAEGASQAANASVPSQESSRPPRPQSSSGTPSKPADLGGSRPKAAPEPASQNASPDKSQHGAALNGSQAQQTSGATSAQSADGAAPGTSQAEQNAAQQTNSAPRSSTSEAKTVSDGSPQQGAQGSSANASQPAKPNSVPKPPLNVDTTGQPEASEGGEESPVKVFTKTFIEEMRKELPAFMKKRPIFRREFPVQTLWEQLCAERDAHYLTRFESTGLWLSDLLKWFSDHKEIVKYPIETPGMARPRRPEDDKEEDKPPSGKQKDSSGGDGDSGSKPGDQKPGDEKPEEKKSGDEDDTPRFRDQSGGVETSSQGGGLADTVSSEAKTGGQETQIPAAPEEASGNAASEQQSTKTTSGKELEAPAEPNGTAASPLDESVNNATSEAMQSIIPSEPTQAGDGSSRDPTALPLGGAESDGTDQDVASVSSPERSVGQKISPSSPSANKERTDADERAAGILQTPPMKTRNPKYESVFEDSPTSNGTAGGEEEGNGEDEDEDDEEYDEDDVDFIFEGWTPEHKKKKKPSAPFVQQPRAPTPPLVTPPWFRRWDPFAGRIYYVETTEPGIQFTPPNDSELHRPGGDDHDDDDPSRDVTHPPRVRRWFHRGFTVKQFGGPDLEKSHFVETTGRTQWERPPNFTEDHWSYGSFQRSLEPPEVWHIAYLYWQAHYQVATFDARKSENKFVNGSMGANFNHGLCTRCGRTDHSAKSCEKPILDADGIPVKEHIELPKLEQSFLRWWLRMMDVLGIYQYSCETIGPGMHGAYWRPYPAVGDVTQEAKAANHNHIRRRLNQFLEESNDNQKQLPSIVIENGMIGTLPNIKAPAFVPAAGAAQSSTLQGGASDFTPSDSTRPSVDETGTASEDWHDGWENEFERLSGILLNNRAALKQLRAIMEGLEERHRYTPTPEQLARTGRGPQSTQDASSSTETEQKPELSEAVETAAKNTQEPLPAAPTKDDVFSPGLQASAWAPKTGAPANAPLGPRKWVARQSLSQQGSGSTSSTNGRRQSEATAGGSTGTLGRNKSQGQVDVGALKQNFAGLGRTGTPPPAPDFTKPTASTSDAGKGIYQPAGRATEFVNTPTTPNPMHQQAPTASGFPYGHPQYQPSMPQLNGNAPSQNAFAAPSGSSLPDEVPMSPGTVPSITSAVDAGRKLTETLAMGDVSTSKQQGKPVPVVNLPGAHTTPSISTESGTRLEQSEQTASQVPQTSALNAQQVSKDKDVSAEVKESQNSTSAKPTSASSSTQPNNGSGSVSTPSELPGGDFFRKSHPMEEITDDQIRAQILFDPGFEADKKYFWPGKYLPVIQRFFKRRNEIAYYDGPKNDEGQPAPGGQWRLREDPKAESTPTPSSHDGLPGTNGSADHKPEDSGSQDKDHGQDSDDDDKPNKGGAAIQAQPSSEPINIPASTVSSNNETKGAPQVDQPRVESATMNSTASKEKAKNDGSAPVSTSAEASAPQDSKAVGSAKTDQTASGQEEIVVSETEGFVPTVSAPHARSDSITEQEIVKATGEDPSWASLVGRFSSRFGAEGLAGFKTQIERVARQVNGKLVLLEELEAPNFPTIQEIRAAIAEDGAQDTLWTRFEGRWGNSEGRALFWMLCNAVSKWRSSGPFVLAKSKDQASSLEAAQSPPLESSEKNTVKTSTASAPPKVDNSLTSSMWANEPDLPLSTHATTARGSSSTNTGTTQTADDSVQPGVESVKATESYGQGTQSTAAVSTHETTEPENPLKPNVTHSAGPVKNNISEHATDGTSSSAASDLPPNFPTDAEIRAAIAKRPLHADFSAMFRSRWGGPEGETKFFVKAYAIGETEPVKEEIKGKGATGGRKTRMVVRWKLLEDDTGAESTSAGESKTQNPSTTTGKANTQATSNPPSEPIVVPSAESKSDTPIPAAGTTTSAKVSPPDGNQSMPMKFSTGYPTTEEIRAELAKNPRLTDFKALFMDRWGDDAGQERFWQQVVAMAYNEGGMRWKLRQVDEAAQKTEAKSQVSPGKAATHGQAASKQSLNASAHATEAASGTSRPSSETAKDSVQPSTESVHATESSSQGAPSAAPSGGPIGFPTDAEIYLKLKENPVEPDLDATFGGRWGNDGRAQFYKRVSAMAKNNIFKGDKGDRRGGKSQKNYGAKGSGNATVFQWKLVANNDATINAAKEAEAFAEAASSVGSSGAADRETSANLPEPFTKPAGAAGNGTSHRGRAGHPAEISPAAQHQKQQSSDQVAEHATLEEIRAELEKDPSTVHIYEVFTSKLDTAGHWKFTELISKIAYTNGSKWILKKPSTAAGNAEEVAQSGATGSTSTGIDQPGTLAPPSTGINASIFANAPDDPVPSFQGRGRGNRGESRGGSNDRGRGASNHRGSANRGHGAGHNSGQGGQGSIGGQGGGRGQSNGRKAKGRGRY